MAATKVWKGTLQLGLLNIGIFLNVAAREKRISMHLFHSACNGPAKRPLYCPACQTMLQDSEVYRAYTDAGGIIPISDDELESIAPESSKIMEITSCVKQESVDQLFLAESFFILPDETSGKAYGLLAKVLTDTKRCAIAQISKSNREHVMLIRPKNSGLIGHYLWYGNEVAQVPEFESLEMPKLSASEVKLASQLVESLDGEFNPDELEDSYTGRLTTLISSKLPDSKIAPPTPVKSVPQAQNQDIMSVLTASLAKGKPHRAIKLDDEPPIKAAKSKKGKKAA